MNTVNGSPDFLIPELSTHSTPSNSVMMRIDQQIQADEDYWLGQAGQLHDQLERLAFSNWIRSNILSIRFTIDRMLGEGKGGQEMIGQLSILQTQFCAAAQDFRENCQKYEFEKHKLFQEYANVSSKIQNDVDPFYPSFERKPKQDARIPDLSSFLDPSHIDRHPFENYAKIEMAEAMAGTHAAAKVVHWVGDALVESVKAVFNITPEMKEIGKRTVESVTKTAKSTLEAVGMKEPVKKAIQAINSCDGSSTVPFLEHYGIPEEKARPLARQYVSDVATVGTALIPLPPVLSLAKRAYRLGRKAAAGATSKIAAEAVSVKTPIIQTGVKLPARKITQPTKLIPEDIGVPSKIFFDRPSRTLNGIIIPNKKNLKVVVKHIFINKGELLNWKISMSYLKNLARANGASVLQFEASFMNPKFLRVMQKLYGKPQSRVVQQKGQVDSTWHLFNIPVAQVPLRPSLKTFDSKVKYQIAIKAEKALVDRLERQVPPLKLPVDFPKYLNQFLSRSQVYQFKGSRLGMDKKGMVDGQLLYQQMGDSVVFLIQNSHSIYQLIKEKVAFPFIKSSGVAIEERLEYILETIFRFAQERGCKRLFIAWNPLDCHVALSLTKESKTLLGMGKFSNGVQTMPWMTVEVDIASSTAVQALAVPKKTGKTLASTSSLNVSQQSLYSQEVIREIKTVIKGESREYALSTLLYQNRTSLERLLPTFATPVNPEELWTFVISRLNTPLLKERQIQILNHYREEAITLAKVTDRQHAFLIREESCLSAVAAELMSLDFLRSLELKYLQLPDVIAVGQYHHFNEGLKALLIKTHSSGETIEVLMQKAGNLLSTSSTNQEALLVPLHQSCYAAGKMMAEVHSKGRKRAMVQDQSNVEGLIIEVNKMCQDVRKNLHEIGMSETMQLQHYFPKIESILEDFRHSPGIYCYGFGENVNVGDVMWSNSERFSVGLFNQIDRVASTFNVAREPLGIAYQEYGAFLYSIGVEGLEYGLPLKAVQALQQSFKHGYVHEQAILTAPKRFFEFSTSLRTINHLATSIANTESIEQRAVLKTLIDQLAKDLSQMTY